MKDRIGIDVSKDHLDVYCFGDGRAARFGNDAAGFRKFKAWLPEAGCLARVVYEATGPYHAALERPLSGALAASCRWSRACPCESRGEPGSQARRFAQSKGSRAKTDAVDV